MARVAPLILLFLVSTAVVIVAVAFPNLWVVMGELLQIVNAVALIMAFFGYNSIREMLPQPGAREPPDAPAPLQRSRSQAEQSVQPAPWLAHSYVLVLAASSLVFIYYTPWTWEYARVGLRDVNSVIGILLAVGATYFVSAYNRVFVAAFVSVIAYVVMQTVLPVIANNAAFRLPPIIESAYWQHLVTVYAGFLIVISALYIVKKVVLSAR